SYRFQADTPASDFLIALRLDPGLQDRYRRDPQAALADPRFGALSDRERALLASRDAGAIQIAAKGAYSRSQANEELITDVLNGRALAADLVRSVSGHGDAARPALDAWLERHGSEPDRARFHASVDWMYRNAAFPWT